MPDKQTQIIRFIGDILVQTNDYGESLRQSAAAIAENLATDNCQIFLYDENVRHLVLLADGGATTTVDSDFEPLLAPAGVIEHAFATQETVNVTETAPHPDCRPLDTSENSTVQALLAVPLVSAGRNIGVLSMTRARRVRFGADVVAGAQAVAIPLATFIEHARLADRLASAKARKADGQPPKRIVLEGTPVSAGIVRGRAYFFVGSEALDKTQPAYTEDIEGEKALFRKTLEVARDDTLELQQEAQERVQEADAAIFYAHMLLLEDPLLVSRIQQSLERGLTLRYALKKAWLSFEKEFGALEDTSMQERRADLKDVVFRIYQAADEIEGILERPYRLRNVRASRKPIVVTGELLPSELVRLPLANLGGIVCERGGVTSHLAILAKTLQIPTLVGVRGLREHVRKQDELLMDCRSGRCFVRPSQYTIRKYKSVLAEQPGTSAPAASQGARPALTQDGVRVNLRANVALLNELEKVKTCGATGIGLYRTEFLFMIRSSSPTEEEQYEVFRHMAKSVPEDIVTVRLLDVGGDKTLPCQAANGVRSSVRGIRFLLENMHYMKPHVRAILRAAEERKINILLPMVPDLSTLLRARETIDEIAQELQTCGIECRDRYRIGAMLELPSLFWDLEKAIHEVDFINVGTNDLAKYAFGIDRNDQNRSHQFADYHPILFRMLRRALVLMHPFSDKYISVCGELAGSPLGAALLVGAGYRNLSMTPASILPVRDALALVDVDECQDLFRRVAGSVHADDTASLLTDFAEQHRINGDLVCSARQA